MTEKLTILIVDGNRTNLALMDMLVRKLPNCSTELYADPVALLDQLNTISFDVAIFDNQLPSITGIELTRSVKAHSRHSGKPIVIVTADQDRGLRKAALAAGAAEFLHRPIEPLEFKMRLSALARLSDGQRAFQKHTGWAWTAGTGENDGPPLEQEELVSAFARAAGYKDRETHMHATRMACYATILAHHLGLTEEACAELRLAAPLHDIGKVGLRDEVLQSRGLLTEEQRRHMAEHTRIGHAILSGGRSRVMRLAAEIALSHHERWDGTGYPQGLRGEQIPLSGRIAAVADVFDALTSVRTYKSAWTLNHAFAYLCEHAGELFDPACVAAFQMGREEVAAVMSMMPDHDSSSDADAA